jgi:hypothetical protein
MYDSVCRSSFQSTVQGQNAVHTSANRETVGWIRPQAKCGRSHDRKSHGIEEWSFRPSTESVRQLLQLGQVRGIIDTSLYRETESLISKKHVYTMARSYRRCHWLELICMGCTVCAIYTVLTKLVIN